MLQAHLNMPLGTLFLWAVCFTVTFLLDIAILGWIHILIGISFAVVYTVLVSNQSYYSKTKSLFGRDSLLFKFASCPKCLTFWSVLTASTVYVAIFDSELFTMFNPISSLPTPVHALNVAYFILITVLHSLGWAGFAIILFLSMSIVKGGSPLKCCGK